jgi:hypothetical protein
MPPSFTPPSLDLHSFDLFDTLIARRCLDPLSLYAMVEQHAGLPGLAQARSQAGHALWSASQDHSTLDIYTLAVRELKAQVSAADLAQLEFECELEQCIPVRRHLEQLTPRSLIISDMHHPRWQIEHLLAQAASCVGVRWPQALYLSNRGKHDGVAWAELQATCGHLQHVGDNLHSDVQQAQAHGHQATHSVWALPTPAEQLLIQQGFRPVALAARAARLRCIGHSDAASAQLGLWMSDFVFPILALGAVWLHALARKQGIRVLLFVGRDGGVWQRVFRQLYPDMPTQHLYASRTALTQGSSDFHAYVQQQLAPLSPETTLMVDLCGTGASWQAYASQHAVKLPAQAVLLRYPTHLASLPVTALLDCSASTTPGIHALEAFCEEGFASVLDVDFFATPGKHAFAVPRQQPGLMLHHTSRSNAAGMLQNILQTACEELVRTMPTHNAHVNAQQLLGTCQTLFNELVARHAEIERITNFFARNQQLSQTWERP